MWKNKVRLILFICCIGIHAMESVTNISELYNIAQVFRYHMIGDMMYVQCIAGVVMPENNEWCELLEISLSTLRIHKRGVMPRTPLCGIVNGNPIIHDALGRLSIVPLLSVEDYTAGKDPRSTAEGNFAYEGASHCLLEEKDVSDYAKKWGVVTRDLLETFCKVVVLETGQIVIISTHGLACIYDLMLRTRKFINLGHPVEQATVSLSSRFGILIASCYIDNQEGERKIAVYSSVLGSTICDNHIATTISYILLTPQSDHLVIVGGYNEQRAEHKVFIIDLTTMYRSRAMFTSIREYALGYRCGFCSTFKNDYVLVRNDATGVKEIRSLYTFEPIAQFLNTCLPGYRRTHFGVHLHDFYVGTLEENIENQNAQPPLIVTYGQDSYQVAAEFLLHNHTGTYIADERVSAVERMGILKRGHPALTRLGLRSKKKSSKIEELNRFAREADEEHERFIAESHRPRKLIFSDELSSPTKRRRTLGDELDDSVDT